jgi:uncharacterized membrane protein
VRARAAPGSALAFVAVLAVGCGGGEEEQVVRTDPVRVTGAFDGVEYQLFLCTEGDEPIPVVQGPLLYELAEFHAEMIPALAPGETIFVDLLGEAVQEGDEVSFDVLEVYRAGWEDWGCTWAPTLSDAEWAASGTEPFWSVEVSRDSLVVYRPDADELRVAHVGYEGDPVAGWRFTLEVEGEAWDFDVAPEPCRNAMSGGYSHLRVSIRRPDGDWQGCGFTVPEWRTDG